MAYQFAHVEGYGRASGKGKKGGHDLASIVAEAERQPGACPHIEHPREPQIAYGVAPSEAARLATAWAEESRDARGRKLRKDALCMLGGVVTLPAGMSERWEKFSHDSVKWLRREYGKRLVSVVEHHDEANPHLHFYVVPLKGERFSVIHDGLAAAEKADPKRGDRTRTKAEKTQGRKAAREAYTEAMRKWQDRFNQVARRYGLARIGPKRRRLSRDEYQAENAIREATAARELALEGKEHELSAMQDTLDTRMMEARTAAEEHARKVIAEKDAYVQQEILRARAREARALTEAQAAKEYAAKVEAEAYQKANAWCVERDKVADREAYQRIKRKLPPQMQRALEGNRDGLER